MAEITAANWWEPHNPSKILPGILFEDEDQTWVLQLDGTFQELVFPINPQGGPPVPVPITLPDDPPLLVGTTSKGQFVSLFGCQVLQAALPLPSSRGFMKIRPLVLVYDVHFDSVADFLLTSLSIRYSNLNAWVATSGFTVKLAPTLYPIEVTYAKPDAIQIELPNGLTVGVGFSASGPTLPAATELHVLQQAWLEVESPEGKSFDELITAIESFANLISLSIGQRLQRLEILGTCNTQNSAERTRLRLIYNRESPASFREVATWDMLFTLPEVRGRFGQVLLAWFARDENLQSLYDLYFGTLRSSSMYAEHRFLNMFQAIESYDRRMFQESIEKVEEREKRVNRILSSVNTNVVNSDDRRWLRKKLELRNETAAAERIKRIVAQHDAAWLLCDEDIERAGVFRNYHTHFDPKLESKLPPKKERLRELYNLSVRLQILCELILLSAIGFSNAELKERMDRTRRAKRRLIA